MSTKTNKTQAPKPAGFDKGPRDFFRGSRGVNPFKGGPVSSRSFIGFRRGSK